MNLRIKPGPATHAPRRPRQAYDLLGKTEKPGRIRAAREKGMTDEWVRERLHAIKEAEDKKKEEEKKKNEEGKKEAGDKSDDKAN